MNNKLQNKNDKQIFYIRFKLNFNKFMSQIINFSKIKIYKI
jgi:hypothetical protein